MSKKFLLEIGVEELPARYINDAKSQLKENTKKALVEERIEYENINLLSSPRRLTIIISGLSETGKSMESMIKGPSKKIAFDEDNNPTKALLGFMRGQGVELKDTYIESLNGEEYVYAKSIKEGKKLEQVLKDNLEEIIKNINFPKSMKWGGKNLKFARPIRWIMAILDNKVLDFELEGIKATNKTRGHRFLGKRDIEIDNIDNYEDILKDNYVIADENKRRDMIRYGMEKLAREKGGTVQKDEELLDEVTNLVEYPTPIIGRIKDEYLKLPFDVITTPMKEHLRYFPVLDDKQRLLPYFITVRNGDNQYEDIVIKGNEKVLGARLEDAKFFYKEDMKYPLEDYLEKLKTVTFHEKLGSMYDKTIRIRKLSNKIGEYLQVGDETMRNLDRASYLAKADLVTKMVTEFTELQGKIGMEYAMQADENEIVSLSIFEQYLPRFSGDNLPTTTAGSVLSISDKLDSICGLFAIGIQPTGSQDPFAMRRSAIGIINIIIDKKLNVSLMDFIDFSLYIYVEENGLACDYKKVRKQIVDFFMGRVRNLFLEKGISYDIIDSIINSGTDNIYDMKIRVEKIEQWASSEDIEDMLSSFNRISTLAIKGDSTEVKRDLLSPEGIALYDSYNSIEDKVDAFISKKEYDKALILLSSLKISIDNFFDSVMVMVDDAELRNNRLALIKKIYLKMLKICDITYIVNR